MRSHHECPILCLEQYIFSLVTLSESLVTVTRHKILSEVLSQMEYLALKPLIWLMLLKSCTVFSSSYKSFFHNVNIISSTKY